MKEIKKQVSLRTLYDILNLKSEKKVDWADFIFQISTLFLNSPAVEFRFHNILKEKGIDIIYIIKHSDIASALEEKTQPKPEDRL